MKVQRLERIKKVDTCPRCRKKAKRHSRGQRKAVDLGGVVVEVAYSKHYCTQCRKHFSTDTSDIAGKWGRYTNRVHDAAMKMMTGTRSITSLRQVSKKMARLHKIRIPETTLSDWKWKALTL